MKGLDFCCEVIPYPVVLNLRSYCLNRFLKIDREWTAWTGDQYLIAGRKITVECAGDPNAALLNKKACPIEANGALGATTACEALRSRNG